MSTRTCPRRSEYAIAGAHPDAAYRMAGALWRYWEISGQWSRDGRGWPGAGCLLVPAAAEAAAFRAVGNLARTRVT